MRYPKRKKKKKNRREGCVFKEGLNTAKNEDYKF